MFCLGIGGSPGLVDLVLHGLGTVPGSGFRVCKFFELRVGVRALGAI